MVERRVRHEPHEIKVHVKHTSYKTNEIKSRPEPGMDQSDSIVYGIDLFEEVWSHLESRRINQ